MVASPELIIDGKSSKENVKDTKERVKSQVYKELQQLTNEIGNNFYSINENGEVEYNLDLVKEYLETKKDKQYSELKSQNTSAWIMAVQIALSSVGYDVGKVDGILRNKGAKTSKTVAQIIKFQKDNGLKPDGQPGSKTITKLLEKLLILSQKGEPKEENNGDVTEESDISENSEKYTDVSEDDDTVKENSDNVITEEKFDELRSKSELSDDEIKQVVAYANKHGSWLSLRITAIKNKKQLKELSNVEWLALNGLRKITLEQAKIITSGKVKKLELESLDGWGRGSMTDEVAKELSKIKELYVNPAWLTERQKNILTNRK